MDKEALHAFLASRPEAVIATCGPNGFPESALVGFGQTENVEIIFGTSNTSRKYANLKSNNRVSLVIGWEKDWVTVQYEGLARELSKSEWDTYLSIYHKKVPSAAKYQSNPDQSYWLVKPVWIRYSDLSSDEEVIKEYTFA